MIASLSIEDDKILTTKGFFGHRFKFPSRGGGTRQHVPGCCSALWGLSEHILCMERKDLGYEFMVFFILGCKVENLVSWNHEHYCYKYILKTSNMFWMWNLVAWLNPVYIQCICTYNWNNKSKIRVTFLQCIATWLLIYVFIYLLWNRRM